MTTARRALLLLVAGGCTSAPEGPADVYVPQPEAECDALPGAPLPMSPVPGHANEDLTFDTEGLLVGADNMGTLWRVEADGTEHLVLPQSGVSAGLRVMPWDGRVASAQYETDAVYAIDLETGGSELLLGGLTVPTGLEITRDGSIWISEIWGERVLRYHVETGELTVVASGFQKIQGLSFSPGYDLLYFAVLTESRIYALPVDPETLEPAGEPVVFAEEAGTELDGLGVDACGNVYAGSWGSARLVRYGPDGSGPEVLVDEPDADHGLGNFVWGAENGGWVPTALYVVETGRGTVRRIDVGVRDKPR